MTDDRRDDEPADRDDSARDPALDAWDTPPPPADFAQRVLAARGRAIDVVTPAAAADPAAEARRAARIRWSVIAVAAAGAILFWAWRSSPGGGQALLAKQRTPVCIGPDAVAVAEAGAALRWQVTGDGAHVDQTAGSVLYTVEPGSRFEVATPHGTASVRGTVFRVEVSDMKIPKSSLIGAAIGAALVVTVYEGRVLFAGKSGDREITAGQKLELGSNGAPLLAGPARPLADWEKPPAGDISREDLLARDARQRAALAEARERERALRRQAGGTRVVVGGPEGPGGGRDEPFADGRPWFDPSPETLRQWADECRVRMDSPPIFENEPMHIGGKLTADLGLTDAEAAAANEVLTALHAEVAAELRKLYIEATGDADRAADLAPDAMVSEIKSKSSPGESGRILMAIARERGGLQQPPADLAQTSPLERWMRLQASLGTMTEQRLAAKLGPERARELREESRGLWGHRMEMAGCPDNGTDDEVEKK